MNKFENSLFDITIIYSTIRGQLNLVYSLPKNFKVKYIDLLKIYQRLSIYFCSFFDLRYFKIYEISYKLPIINLLLSFPVNIKKIVE